MYVFNRITVNPQLPKRIGRITEIANNLWWSWNTEFLRLFKMIDIDLWERCNKNPVKFLKSVEQEKLENAARDIAFIKEYDKIVSNFDSYMNSKSTWFNSKYPDNRNDLIAYFSAEYGLDQTIAIYSGGLGILSGDHLKSASDLGIPLVAVGLLYKNGYFNQIIDRYGMQRPEYRDLDIYDLPITPVKDLDGNDVKSNELFSSNAVTVVNFWFTTCGPCVAELSELDALNKELSSKGGTLIGVNTFTLGGDQGAIADAKDVLSKKGASYRNVYFASDSEAGKFSSNIYAYPTTYVVDRNGKIVGEPIVGAITEKKQSETLKKLIDQAIAADKH